MRVTLVKPFGFCFGVKKAIETAYKAKEENPNQTIYILGNLVHNETVLNEMKDDDFVFLKDDCSLFESELKSLNDGSIIVFSAHGHAPSLDKIALDKKMKMYDATCHFVKINEKKIQEEIENGNEVIFIGVKNHAEANASISIDRHKVHLYDCKSSFDYENVNSISPLIVSQTTMTSGEIENATKEIINKFPKAKIAAKRCFATESRQDNLVKSGKDADAFVIIGSKESNNTQKLIWLVSKHFPNKKCYSILNVNDLEEYKNELSSYKEIAISSGASTPDSVVLACKKYIEENIR